MTGDDPSVISGVAAHLIYALAWLTFGLGHSLLASEGLTAGLRSRLGAFYRLTYNLFAAAHLALVWLVGAWLFAGAPAYDRPPLLAAAMTGGAIAGLVVLAVGLTGYDLGRFAGTTQIRHHLIGLQACEHEPLRMDGIHRFIRHPLYAGAVLVLWGRIADDFDLATAAWASLYFFVGTLFEERRLLRLYGEEYAEYRRRVPAVVPWRGRALP